MTLSPVSAKKTFPLLSTASPPPKAFDAKRETVPVGVTLKILKPLLSFTKRFPAGSKASEIGAPTALVKTVFVPADVTLVTVPVSAT
jgi:hypothetical protein